MADTTLDIVTAAAKDIPAEGGSEGGDESTADTSHDGAEGADAADDGAAAAVETPADGSVAVVKPAVEEDDDPELTKLLEEVGIKQGPIQRDNRFPYSRVRKISGKLVKKVRDIMATDVKSRDEKITAAEQQLESFRKADQLASTDPERYMLLLAGLHPDKYGRYVRQPAAEVAKPAPATVVPVPTDRPGPDIKYDDGTFGYSPEQLDRREQWMMAKAKSDALDEADKRYGGFFKELAANKETQAAQVRVTASVERQKALWGELFTDEYKKGNNSDILKVMQADRSLSFDAACAKVLAPRVEARYKPEREKMRTELMAELNKRPAAATKVTPVAAKRAEPTGERTTEDIVREMMGGLR